MPTDPHDPRPTGQVTAHVRGLMRGLEIELDLAVDIRRLDASLGYLIEQGLQPPPRPMQFETTPDGLPVCPRHHIPMREREKQGDTWHSHQVVAEDGEVLWCRGYAGPDSPGYAVEPAVGSGQQAEQTVPAASRQPAAGGYKNGTPTKPQQPPRPARPPRRSFGEDLA